MATPLILTALATGAQAQPSTERYMRCLGFGDDKELIMMKIKMDVAIALTTGRTSVVPGEVTIAGVKPNRDEPGLSGYLGTTARPLEFMSLRVSYSKKLGPLIMWNEDGDEGVFEFGRVKGSSLVAEITLPRTTGQPRYSRKFKSQCYLELKPPEPGDWSWVDPFGGWPY